MSDSLEKKRASVSSISSFNACRRQFWFDQTWHQFTPPKPLWIGQVVHQAMDSYYKSGRDAIVAIESAKEFVFEEIDRIKGELPWFSDPSGELEEWAEFALAVFHNYTLFDSCSPFDGMVVDVERSFRLPVERTDRLLSGRIDLVLRSNSTGRLWIVDHKTVSSQPNLAGLDVDEQMSAYAWAAWRLYGEIPEKIIYNVIFKSLPKEPYVIRNGKALSQSKSEGFVYDLYLAKLQEMGFPVTDYVEMLEYLRTVGWSQFFSRVESSRSLAELVTFEKFAASKLNDISRILEDPEHYAYPSPNSFSCGYCAYLAACKTMNDGGDWESVLDSRFARW